MNSNAYCQPQALVATGRIRFHALMLALLSMFFATLAFGGTDGKDILSADERAWLEKNQPRIVLAVETGYAPFVFIGANGQATGLAHDYMRLIEQKLGVQFRQRKFSSLDEIFQKVRGGEVQIVNAVTSTPDRIKFLSMTAPYVSVPNVIIVSKEQSGQITEGKLAGLKVSMVKSYAVTEHLAKRGLHFIPDLVPDDLTALLNVSFGRSDAAVLDLATASYLISEKGIANLRMAGEVAYDIRLSIATPLDEPMLYGILKKGLDAVSDTERQEIKNRWINISKGQDIYQDRRFWEILGSVLAVVVVAITLILIWNRMLRQQVAVRTRALERTNRLFATLSETNKAIARIRDRNELLQAACHAAVELGKLKMAWIALRDPRTGHLELAASCGLPEGRQDISGGTLCEACLNNEAPVGGNDCKHGPSAPWSEHAALPECGSLSCCRLYQGGHHLGVLMLCAGEPDFFDETALSVVNEMATDLSLAIVSLDRDQMLIQQSRLAAMGEMIGNIGHQWRQPINALTLLLANLKDAYEFNELTRESLDGTVKHGQQLIQRMSSTIDDFRNFFRPNKTKQTFRASDGVEEAIKLVRESFKDKAIEIELNKIGEPCIVTGYPNEFAQVVLNALSNAKDAIIEKKVRGKVRIGFEQGTETATVSILDNGGGIPEANLPKVFDAYFTTKEEGTGIGLYMSRMIMDNMGGEIAIRNAGDGVEVLLTLPLADDSTPG